jgi:hypothetical protein
MRPWLAAPLALFSSYGWTQQLVAVQPPSDSSGLIAVGIVALVGGLAFLKIKYPDRFDKILGRALKLKSKAEDAFEDIRYEAKKIRPDQKIPAPTDVLRVGPQAPKPAPPMRLADAIKFLRAHYPELLVETPPTPEEWERRRLPATPGEPAPQVPATPAGPKFVDGRLVA